MEEYTVLVEQIQVREEPENGGEPMESKPVPVSEVGNEAAESTDVQPEQRINPPAPLTEIVEAEKETVNASSDAAPVSESQPEQGMIVVVIPSEESDIGQENKAEQPQSETQPDRKEPADKRRQGSNPDSSRETEKPKEIRPVTAETSTPATATAAPTPTPSPAPTPRIGKTGVDLKACQMSNGDFVAWLKIPGTKINYPVVWTDRVDYYLTHTFSGKESKIGTLFSLGKTDYKTPGRNIAVYGHHITTSGGNMFQPLMSYKKKSFYESHKTVYFDTLYDLGEYTIFAVINIKSTDWDASMASFDSDQSFLSFVNRAKAASLFDTGVEVTEKDHILTLITCDRDYHNPDGRLIVMAVKQ